MELFDFARFLSRASPAEIEAFDREIGRHAESGRYRDAVNCFLARVPVCAPGINNEAYFREELNYLRALLYAATGDRASALAQIEALQIDSGGDYQDLLFSDHVGRAIQLGEHQARAIASGKPGILITALPKSASAFLSNTLAEALDVPLLRASLGSFPEMIVVPRWLRQIARGGCVTHDHFDGTSGNLTAIAASGIQQLFVQLRDPRAALWSYVHHERRARSDMARSLEALIGPFYKPAISWIVSWLEAASSLTGRFQVYFTDYPAVSEAPQAVLEAILHVSQAERFIPETVAFLTRRRSGNAAPENFRSGKAEEWREHIPLAIQNQLWGLLPTILREKMKLQR